MLLGIFEVVSKLYLRCLFDIDVLFDVIADHLLLLPLVILGHLLQEGLLLAEDVLFVTNVVLFQLMKQLTTVAGLPLIVVMEVHQSTVHDERVVIDLAVFGDSCCLVFAIASK